jgi:hypothetical protein
MRVAQIVVNHTKAILDESLVRKGYLFYPVLPGQYSLILQENDTKENRDMIIREAADCFMVSGYEVDITEGGFRVYFSR